MIKVVVFLAEVDL